METSQRTVLPPNDFIMSNESNKLPSLIPHVQHGTFQEGQHSRLSTVNKLKQLESRFWWTDDNKQVSPSDNLDHRLILSKASRDVSKIHTQRIVLLPQGNSKSEPSKSTEPTGQHSHFSLSANEHAMTRQACEEELEFLKLKLRYMQNDIEFKKSQIDSTKISKPKSSTIPHKWNGNRLQLSNRANSAQDTQMTSTVNCYPVQSSKINSRASATQWSAQVAGLQQIKAKASMPTKYSSMQDMVTKINTNPVITISQNATTVYSWNSYPVSRTNLDKLLPTSSSGNVRTIYSVCEKKQYDLVRSADISDPKYVPAQQKYFSKNQTANIVSPTCSYCTDTNIISSGSETGIPLSNISTKGTAISAFQRLGNQRVSEVSNAVSASPDKRLVVLSSKTIPSVTVPLDSAQTICQTVSSPALNSNLQIINNAKIPVTSCNESISNCSHAGTHSHLHDIEHSEKSSEVSRYKLVKHSSSLPAQTTSRASTTVSLSSAILPVKAADIMRGSQVSRLSLRSPNLKIQTAAKLVSKYKLKKLSPTSTSSAAPPLFNNKAYCRKSPLYPKEDSKIFSQYSKSQHKLDRRPTTTQPSYNNFKSDIYNSHVNVLTKRHNTDHRSTMNQSFKAVRDLHIPLGRNELKIDNRTKRSNIYVEKLDFHGIKNVHKLDRRSFKIDKCKVNPRQAVINKGGKHYWISNQLFTLNTCKGSRRPKYIWRKASMLQSKSSHLSSSHNSRFRWSRPNLQSQNGAWQQLRQKLQLLLMKKHRHSRFKFSKSTSLAVSSSVYNKRLQFGDYKTNLVTIDGVTYKSSSRKLTRTRRSSTFSFVKKATPAPRITSVPNKAASSAPVTTRKSSASLTDMNVVNFANRAIHRSIAITAAKYRKNNLKSKIKTPYCIYFGRFGKCNRGDKCPYVHDPEKVAVCTGFLRGKCDAKGCPFSHKTSKNKIPVCLFYLRGSCSRENCPYLHVRVNPNAPVCKDFRNGFCALGEECKKIHSHVCPSFAVTGTCFRGGICTMLHRTSKREQDGLPSQTKNTRQHQPVDKKRTVPHLSSVSYPLKSGKLIFTPPCTTLIAPQPSFISLETSPSPSFISLNTSPAPSFISLETNTQERIEEKDGKGLYQGKPGFLLGKVDDTVLKSAQEISTRDAVTSIRPSFLASK